MPRTVRAIYDHGVLRPLERLDLPECEEVTIVILGDDVSSREVVEIAIAGHSFDFLSEPAEEVYTREDGEPV